MNVAYDMYLDSCWLRIDMYQEGFSPIVAFQFFSYGRKKRNINGVIFTDSLIDGTYGYGVESYYPTSI